MDNQLKDIKKDMLASIYKNFEFDEEKRTKVHLLLQKNKPSNSKQHVSFKKFIPSVMTVIFLCGFLLMGWVAVNSGMFHSESKDHTATKNTNKQKNISSKLNTQLLTKTFLEKHNLTIKSFNGQNTINLTDSFPKQSTISKGLRAMGVDLIDNSFEFEGNTLKNKNITIVNATVTGFWREKYVNQNTTRISVVISDRKVLGGYTLPVNDGDSEGILNVISQPATNITVTGNPIGRESISRQLVEEYLRRLTNNDVPMNKRISKYGIVQLNIVSFFESGFNFNVITRILPMYKDKYVVTGSDILLKDGWVQKRSYGTVVIVKDQTYLLMGIGSGP